MNRIWTTILTFCAEGEVNECDQQLFCRVRVDCCVLCCPVVWLCSIVWFLEILFHSRKLDTRERTLGSEVRVLRP